MLSQTGAAFQVQINDAMGTSLNQHHPPASSASRPLGPGRSALPLEMAKPGITGRGDEKQALVSVIVVFIRRWPACSVLGVLVISTVTVLPARTDTPAGLSTWLCRYVLLFCLK